MISDKITNIDSYSLFFNDNPTPSILTNLNSGEIFDVNQALLDLLDYNKEEIISRRYEDFIKINGKKIGNKSNTKELCAKNKEIQIIKKDNSIITTIINYKEIILNDIPLIYTTIISIQEQKNVEEELKTKELNLKLLNHISALLFHEKDEINYYSFLEKMGRIAKSEGSCLFFLKNDYTIENAFIINHDCYSNNKYNLTDIISEEILQLWLPEIKKNRIIKKQSKAFNSIENKILASQQISSFIIIPIIVENNPLGFLLFFNCIDINKSCNNEEILSLGAIDLKNAIKKKTIIQKLETEHQQFISTLDALDALVYVSDLKSHEIYFMNKYGRNTWGDYFGKKCYNILQEGQNKACEFCTNHLLIDRKGRPNKPYIWEFHNTVTKRWYQCHDQVIKWPNGKLVRMEIAVDITDYKRIQRELKDSESKLMESNKTKDKFFSIIAHDLRSPFSGLIGFTELLLNNHKEYDDDRKELFFKMINDIAESTYSLLENLLLWSKTQTGDLSFYPTNISLKEIITDNLLITKRNAQAKDIEIVLEDISDNISVYIDKQMINTVIRNLLSNAIKFTPKNGKIKIKLKKDNKDIILYIIDNGIGIPEDKLSKLFKIEENYTSKGTNNENGSGLGLILCKEFIEKNNGKIWVNSEENKGSEFCFSMPLAN